MALRFIMASYSMLCSPSFLVLEAELLRSATAAGPPPPPSNLVIDIQDDL